MEKIQENVKESESDLDEKKSKSTSLCGGSYGFMIPEEFENDEEEEDDQEKNESNDDTDRVRDADNDTLKCNDILTALKERTTCTGLPHYHNSRGSVKKVWWTLITIAAIGGLCFNLSQLFMNYLSFSFNVLIKINTENQLPFPAVTICNMCPVKKSMFLKHFYNVSYNSIESMTAGNGGSSVATTSRVRFKRAIDDVTVSPYQPPPTGCCCSCCVTGKRNNYQSHVTQCKCNKNQFMYNDHTCYTNPLLQFTTATSRATTTTATTTTITTTTATASTRTTSATSAASFSTAATTISSQFSTTIETTVTEELDFSKEIEEKLNESTITEILAGLDADTRKQMGFAFEELILDCTFEGFDCRNLNYFDHFFNGLHGNCYSFNAGLSPRNPVQMALKTGRRHGLQMVMNVNQFEYLSRQNDIAGIRLAVTEQNRMAFPDEQGISLNPGQATSLGLRQSNIQRLAPPHNTCYNNSISDPLINAYEELYPGVKYSTSTCFRTCFQKNLIERCGCGNAFYPLSGMAFGTNISYSYCDRSNPEQFSCMANYEIEFNDEKIECSCPEPCNETYYLVSPSTGEWPTLGQTNTLIQKLQPLVTYDLSTYYRENLVKVELFYEEFNYKEISEVPSYELFQFLSDCGGVLGLWLGMSVLTICEFFEFVVDIMVLGVFVALKKRQKKRRVDVMPMTSVGPSAPSQRVERPQPFEERVEDLEAPPPSYWASSF